MIKTENLTLGGRYFTKTYSDTGMMIERDGVRYSEALDPTEFGRQYIETDEPINADSISVPAKQYEYSY
jgi:hypothetical protein